MTTAVSTNEQVLALLEDYMEAVLGSERGRALLDLKVNAAVRQILALMGGR